MVSFILNNKKVKTDLPSGYLLLDFIREQQQLKGTKIGCREGDCGACTIMIGTLNNGSISYLNATSCLTPIANIHGKHVVTVEGLNMENLSPVQTSIIENNGTQCGFCTVGFVVSLTQFCLSNIKPTYEDAIAAISGNICRCTGYKSIELAAQDLVEKLQQKPSETPVSWLVKHNFIPSYFVNIEERLNDIPAIINNNKDRIIAGGTDQYVQKHDELEGINIHAITQNRALKSIKFKNGNCIIGAATTIQELYSNDDFRSIFPDLKSMFKLISSAPIRNISTVVGNFVNASPIGDLTAFFLVLDTQLQISNGDSIREVPLKKFYNGYKIIDLNEGEYIHSFSFKTPVKNSFINLEKISKRIHLDIASVNTAIQIVVNENIISDIHISIGGVGPIPTYLHKTASFLRNKSLSPGLVKEANEIMQDEISPIGDIRGSIDYKRLLARQLFFAHFIKFFPKLMKLETLVS